MTHINFNDIDRKFSLVMFEARCEHSITDLIIGKFSAFLNIRRQGRLILHDQIS